MDIQVALELSCDAYKVATTIRALLDELAAMKLTINIRNISIEPSYHLEKGSRSGL